MNIVGNLVLFLLGGSVSQMVQGTSVAYYGQSRVREGDSFLISCVTGNSSVVQWTKDGSPVNATPFNKYVFEESHEQTAKVNKLYVAHSQRRHSGDYACVKNTRIYHSLYVEPKERSPRQIENVTCFSLAFNQTLEIPCALGGFKSNSSLTWYKNDEFFSPGTRRAKFGADKLIINSAQPSDAGIYSCLDTTSANHASTSVAPYRFKPVHTIRVTLPILVEDLPQYRVADEGFDVNISCNIQSWPPPKVSWYVGVNLIDPLWSGPRILLSTGEHSIPGTLLTIRNVTIRDKNIYTCKAAHDNCGDNVVQVSTQLYVRLQNIRTNEAQPGGGLVINPGDEYLIISCSHSDNTTKIRWKKDGADFIASVPWTTVFANGTITIKAPTASDVGNYTCEFNGATDSATIEVRYKVTVAQEPSQTNALSAWLEGRDVRITVKVTGFPKPTLLWKKDGKILTTDDRILLEDYMNVTSAVLKIHKLRSEDKGNYTCVASNGKDEATLTFHVRVKGKYAALVPFLGICVEVVTLCVIIYIAETRAARRAREPEEPSEHSRRDEASEEGESVGPPVFSNPADPEVGVVPSAALVTSAAIPQVQVQRSSAVPPAGDDNKKEV